MDGDSYRYHAEHYRSNHNGNGTVILKNDFMPVVPTIITTAETTLKWKIEDESFHKTVSSWYLGNSRNLNYHYGSNYSSIETTGTVTFSYREGCL